MKNYGEEYGWEVDVDFPSWGNNEIYVKTISKTYLQAGEKPKDAYCFVFAVVVLLLGYVVGDVIVFFIKYGKVNLVIV